MTKILRKFSLLCLALVASLGVSAQTFDNQSATISWAVGNESEGTLSDGISNAVSVTKVTVGSDLTTSVISNYAANNGVSMVQYQPGTSNPGCATTDMIEYTVQVKKGLTFKPTSVSYDAVKVGTDNAYFSWSYTIDDTEGQQTAVAATNIIRNNNTTGSPALSHTETITSEGGQKITLRFYISNVANNKQVAIANVKINGTISGTVVARTFKDFEIDLTQNPVGDLPDGVTQVSYSQHDCSYNGTQHGWKWYAVQFAVDGPVKVTLGGCSYQNGYTGFVAEGSETNILGTIDNNTCGTNVSWTYNSETATTLTVYCGQYCPYIKVEACDLIPMRTVTYYDVDGKTVLASHEVEGGSALAYDTEVAGKVTVADGYAFRGWFNSTLSSATKVKEGTSVQENLALYAKATKIEDPQVGDIYMYTLNSTAFYPEDHEAFETTGEYHDVQHGFTIGTNGTVSVKTAGNAVVVFGLCKYGNTGTITVTDAAGNQVGEAISVPVATDGATASVAYTGSATTLTATFSNGGFLHDVTVYNVESIPTKDETTGYYMIKSGDAASLKLAASLLNDGDKIYLPNGTYDVGSNLTSSVTGVTISAKNVSLIGQSMDGVIIKGYGIVESINTATLKITGDNFYAQDVTLQCYGEYGTGADTKSAERALGLWNKSAHSTLKNVYLKGFQDTYYTNGSEGQLGYVENGKIEGTVDFICGAGNHFFKGVNLNCTNSAHKTKGDYIAVPNTYSSEKGYVFDGCNITAEDGQIGTYYLGRAWGGSAANTFVNTTFTNGYAAAVWGPNMSSFSGTRRFAVYPAIDGVANDENALAEVDATISNVLGDWAETAQAEAKQVTELPAEGTFLLEDGTITTTAPSSGKVRVANSRGGFGPEIDAVPTAIASVKATTEASDAPIYNVAGQRVNASAKGILIQNGHKFIK